MARLLVALFLIGFSPELTGQDNIGAGRAISFDGVDDYVNLGNIYDDLALPVTISAWIFLDPRGLGTIFASQDNTQIYSGFHFFVVHTAIVIEYGDGLGNNSAQFKRGKSAPVDNIFGKWVHVTAIMRGASDMDLFLNGVNIGGTYIGESQSPMNSFVPADVAKIGYRSTTAVTYHFQGIMDELRIWNRSLSIDEIRAQMCKKLKGTEPGLIGYWDFDDTKGNALIDKTPNHFDGQLVGNPRSVYSGAPIGDESIALYASDWQEKALALRDGPDKVRVENVTGNPDGLHIYRINQFPSQNKGLNLSLVAAPYFGVFIASRSPAGFFDVEYSYNDSTVCKIYSRLDNSIPGWNGKYGSSLSLMEERIELIKERWDTRLEIDLGPDETPCTFIPRFLNPLSDTTGFSLTWQDGSTLSTYNVTGFGTYWVTADNGCTRAIDTLRISRVPVDNLTIPNVFTPNGDLHNEFFEVDQRIRGGSLMIYDRWGQPVYQSVNYQNDWDGANLPSGVYFYRIKAGGCIEEKRGALSILR